MREENERYLGDGVYAKFDGEYIWLLVGSHDKPTDKVALDIAVYDSLVAFANSKAGWAVVPETKAK